MRKDMLLINPVYLLSKYTMNIPEIFSKALFLIPAILGIMLFVEINIIENTYSKIKKGEQAQFAIQMLDEMRRPVLAIENTFFLELNQASNYKLFNQQIDKTNTILKQYYAAAAYNPEVMALVKKLSENLEPWIELNKKLWTEHLLLSKDTKTVMDRVQHDQLQHQTITQFFKVLDILAMGEKPIHKDIDNGRAAANLFIVSTAILIVYFFILIIFFQKSRNKNLTNQHQKLEKLVAERTVELESANKELQAFSYSVSHDLRAPLRAIDGFSLALIEDYNESLDDTAKDYLNRVRAASQKMAQLIDDLLQLSRISRNEINKQNIDLTELAKTIIHDLKQTDPERKVKVIIADNLTVYGDKSLMTIALTNLLSNAWKYTSNRSNAMIEFGRNDHRGDFFIKDNGVGFDMQYANKLFNAFQRLHGSEFEGTGIGLATVKRILKRHKGDIRAEAKPDEGACFYFSM